MHTADSAAEHLDRSETSAVASPTAAPSPIPTPVVAGQMSSGLAPVMLPLARLRPHPENPRLVPREPVIAAICAALKKNGFDPAYALIVRPYEGDWQILSGHQRDEAAHRAGLTEVPCWVRDYNDDEAYMLLATSNDQGELSSLERGMHALNALSSGMDIKGYAARAGRKQQTVSDEVCAARVAQTVPDVRYKLSQFFPQLVVIHGTPSWLWPALATATLKKKWTVAQTKAASQRLKGLPDDRPEWASTGLPEALVDGSVLPSDLRDFEELRVRTAAGLYNIERQRAAIAGDDPPQEEFGETRIATQMIAEKVSFVTYSEALRFFNGLVTTAEQELAKLRQLDAEKHQTLEEARQSAARHREHVSLEVWHSLDDVTRAALLPPDPALVSPSHFEKQNDAEIEWAAWSWNPITGCEHTCPYCWAREITTSKKSAKDYPAGFAPALRPDALLAPRMMQSPLDGICDPRERNVIVGSMTDLFGRWVPREWIEAVLAEICGSPGWNFLCLTKFPERMVEFDIPPNMWMGATVDLQARVSVAETAFANVKSRVKWLACEPLLEPLQFEHLDRFDWIVMGGAKANKQSGTPEWHPPFGWIADIVDQAREAGVKVYQKSTLFDNRIRELPFDAGVEGGPFEAPAVFNYLKQPIQRSEAA